MWEGRISRHRALLGSLFGPERNRESVPAAAKPKDGRVRVVCLRTAKHWGSSANYKLRCARCALRDKVPEGSGRFREVPVHVAGQSSGGFWKVPRRVREFRVQMPTVTSFVGTWPSFHSPPIIAQVALLLPWLQAQRDFWCSCESHGRRNRVTRSGGVGPPQKQNVTEEKGLEKIGFCFSFLFAFLFQSLPCLAWKCLLNSNSFLFIPLV